MHCSARLFYHNLMPAKPLLAPCVSPPNPNPNPNHNPIFRRDFASSSLFLLLFNPGPLRAEIINNNTPSNSICADPAPTKQAFLDISIDGEPMGRIIIGLYGNEVPAGAARFANIVSGAAGVSYRRKEFVKIMPNYVQHGGLRSYGADAEIARKGGSNLAVESLMDEWEKQNEKCGETKNVAKSVSIIVRDPSKPPPKMKLVARNGKLEIDQEQVGMDPNGTEFVIAIKDSPELDESALVVGRVVEGMEVVERIGKVKTVQENSSSPYFRVAKLIGDKRAVVAERGFNRPYSKVLITNCGLIGS
ncbi:Peptidyl-prolyl cis-trans isomerase [Handroanthus impetiginosus]|uniref:Peptidyl-prolyl cis-trans isomerase n=1 Tax=Handroanthus impetiginosus TaxID=429701 RepID=A0A2G9GKG6_9LAMI|nr:Peptidyl-prolyl cis-trans isomerase [Handroanthus impetiginosus]